MTQTLDPTQLANYRSHTYRASAAQRIQNPDQAEHFVNEREFVFFWPVKDVLMPSLWVGVAGDRPVPNAHDDPGHITWRWKDENLGTRRWFYAKVLRNRATLISLATLPAFYALSNNFGDPENDYLEQYSEGLLTHTARQVYEYLLQNGPLNTVNLRQKLHLTSKTSNSTFNRALNDLQRDFKIMPVGVAETGAWRYSHIYSCVHHHYPDLVAQAATFTRSAAQKQLLHAYFLSVGAASQAKCRQVFQWSPKELERALTALSSSGELLSGYSLPNSSEALYLTPQLLV